MSDRRHQARDSARRARGARSGEESGTGRSSAYPRGRRLREPAPPEVGWRGSKRSSKLGKKVRREVRTEARRVRVAAGVRSARSRFIGILQIAGMTIGGIIAVTAVLALIATGVNATARWLAEREAARAQSPEVLAERARENLLIIGADGDSSAEFLAVRLDEEGGQIYGIAIPSGAFMEVPGYGFERVGNSYAAGAEVSMAAVANYLSIPIERHVVVDIGVYQDALTNQSLRDVMTNVLSADLDDADVDRITTFIAGVTGDRTALIPLPLKPIDLGGQTFFEPQRDKIADLMLNWWGVRLGAQDTAIRVIIYNGVGSPGIAGVAAQQLIESGVKVVDTKNADRFDYDGTLIVVQDGDLAQGERIAEVLGVGEIVDQPSDQDVADVIVILGKDYVPPVR